MFDLSDKIAIITGGGSGIGKSIAKVLASQGAVSCILDIDQENGNKVIKEITDSGGVGNFYHCDVSDQKAAISAINEIHGKFNKIDILVNNAGISHIGKAHSTSEEDFDRIYRINVKGVYNCLYATIPFMKSKGSGSIVNLSSVLTVVGVADRFAYTMSKGAIQSMTYSVAKDYIQDGIRCNAIAPGRVHTPFVDGYLAKNYPGKEKEMFDTLSKTQPIGRMGKPDEIAKLVLYLCSDEAAFITGAVYPIDGGFITLNS
jgi:NAD(P)-dependent dehydrogenase (short-subunit alcohol dehydrogenase family)